ncbi:hypothetical protein JCM14036_03500 [Desulfotomaculum defluvii]
MTIKPQQLNVICTERLKTLGLTPHADYASHERILKELNYKGRLPYHRCY